MVEVMFGAKSRSKTKKQISQSRLCGDHDAENSKHCISVDTSWPCEIDFKLLDVHHSQKTAKHVANTAAAMPATHTELQLAPD